MCRRSGLLGLVCLLCSCSASSRLDADAQAHQSQKADASIAPSDASAFDSAAPDGFDAGTALNPQDAGNSSAADAGSDDALPTNVSFDTARQVDVGAPDVWQSVRSADQVAYYAFRAEEGKFYVLFTNRGTFSPDNVITLYDADHHVIAENDDGSLWPGDQIDARLVIRAPKSGTYYAVVEDLTTPAEYFSGDQPFLYYHLIVQAIDATTPGFALESTDDSPTPVTFVESMPTGNTYITLLGELSDGDQDAFSFDGRTDRALIGDLLAPGPNGDGSTALLGRVRVASADQRAVGYIDRALGQHNIHPPLGDGRYELVVSADGAPGGNGFYVINLTLLPDNPREQYSNSNDTLAMAEPLLWKGAANRRSLLLARLPPGDIDYFSFEVHDGDHVLIGCESESGGSGVHGLRAEVRDELDKVLAFSVEDPSSNLLIDKVLPMTAGMRYLRLSSETAESTQMIDPWVRCVVNVGL